MRRLLPITALTLFGAAALSASPPCQGGQTQFMDVVEDSRVDRSRLFAVERPDLLSRYSASAIQSNRIIIDYKFSLSNLTVDLPPSETIRDFELGYFDADQELDLVVMTQDPSGAGSGKILLYLDVYSSQAPDFTIPSLGPGIHPFTSGSLQTVQPVAGGLDRILIADPDYTVGGLANIGLLVSLDVVTGQPATGWGWQGTYPQARFGAAVAARDATPTAGGVIMVSEPGHQGAQGNQGRVWATNPVNGILWWNAEGQVGTQIGTVAAFLGEWVVFGNPDADHVALGQTGNGCTMHVDVGTLNRFFTYGQGGEHLGKDVAAYGTGHFAVASDRRVALLPSGSGVASHEWQHPDPSSIPVADRSLFVAWDPNLPDPILLVQTQRPGTGNTVEHRESVLTTRANLKSDIFEIPIPQPNTINLVIDKPSFPFGFAFLGFSLDVRQGGLVIPGMDGLLTLTPPIETLGFVPLDANGFGIHTETWPGSTTFNPTGVRIGGAAFGSNPTANASALNTLVLRFVH